MKNKIVTAMTTALVVGAASTTFAAANPFSDVPAGHWAYDAVTQLAADGVVEGYGDGTYLGNRNITRYEMAQMVAKAMAKTNVGGSDKAALDRLAAEFADELNNLGVRVSNLEKYADKVKWNGELRYRYISDRVEQANGRKAKSNRDWTMFRLQPTAEVNDHWKLKARIDATSEMDKDTATTFSLKYAFAEGNYDKFKVSVGRMPLYSNLDDGLLLDDYFSGAQIEIGSKIKFLGEAGRWSNFADPANYQGAELSYNDGNKFMIGASYRHFNTSSFKTDATYNREGKIQDDADIWAAALDYNFDKNVKLHYAYAQNPTADDYNRAWTGQLSYKGANKKAGSWGLYAAYRYAGENVAFVPTYDTYTRVINKKGVEGGVNWSPLNNTLVDLQYFNGKTLSTDKDAETLFARVSWFF